MKILGGGRVEGELHVTADAFTQSAREMIESAGGSVALTERAEADAENDTETDSDEERED